MGESGSDKYLLAGLDNRLRGFSRTVEFEQIGESYRAVLRYETVRISTERHPRPDAAILTLIQTLQVQGYRQLRTQVSFRNGVYLGSQKMWVEYPDPPEPEPEPSGFFARILNWFRPHITNEQSKP